MFTLQIPDGLEQLVLPFRGILLRWKDNLPQYPGLAQLTERLLRVQASSAPSERNFSVEGSVITKRRTCLRPSTVNDILFLNSQLKKWWTVDTWPPVKCIWFDVFDMFGNMLLKFYSDDFNMKKETELSWF